MDCGFIEKDVLTNSSNFELLEICVGVWILIFKFNVDAQQIVFYKILYMSKIFMNQNIFLICQVWNSSVETENFKKF